MRLLTRPNFDGLTCAILLKKAMAIDGVEFVHPKDIQDGTHAVGENDVLANTPYVQGCVLWFDHQFSEEECLNAGPSFKGCSRPAPSTARIIYDYYSENNDLAHLEILVDVVDKFNSESFTPEEILEPRGWIMLAFIIDPRTELGRFKDFRISNYELMELLVECCQNKTIEEIMEMPDVQERVELYFEHQALFSEMLQKYSRVEGNVIVTDLRGVDKIHPGNRFILYSLFPEQNISVWAVDDKTKENCIFAVGHSVFNRTSKTDVGLLMQNYGGGGHQMVGICKVPNKDAERVLDSLVEAVREDDKAV